MLLEHNDKTLLIDAGSTLQCALDFHKINVKSIDAIFITHLHGDHIGGLEYIGFYRYFGSFPFGSNKPKLFVHPTLIDDLTTYLMVTMGTTTVGKMTIHDYFDVIVDDADRILSEFLDLTVEQVPVNHVGIGDSIALSIKSTDENKSLFFTGDVRDSKSQNEWGHGLVFHDCEFAEYQGGVHAQYHELLKLPLWRRNKIILMHSNIMVDEWLINKVKHDGFHDIASRGYKCYLWDHDCDMAYR